VGAHDPFRIGSLIYDLRMRWDHFMLQRAVIVLFLVWFVFTVLLSVSDRMPQRLRRVAGPESTLPLVCCWTACALWIVGLVAAQLVLADVAR
jgi:hypothetical protein